MDKILNKKLINLVEESFGTYDFDLLRSTSIENDLGISGEDGYDFIKKYSKKFNIDISEFNFSDYFYPEPSLFVEYGDIKPLTLGDLESGIHKGFLR